MGRPPKTQSAQIALEHRGVWTFGPKYRVLKTLHAVGNLFPLRHRFGYTVALLIA